LPNRVRTACGCSQGNLHLATCCLGRSSGPAERRSIPLGWISRSGIIKEMIKAILFDADGVLINSQKANIALFKNLLTAAGYPTPSDQKVVECFHLPLWQSLEKLTGSKDQAEIKRIWEKVQDRAMRTPELLEFPENFERTLESLHKKYKLAIVTSRVRVGIDDMFEIRDIGRLFDVVVTFEDYENPKPHPEPLLTALKKLRTTADEAVYVGDSSTDIEAAQAAGMKSIHLAPLTHKQATAGITRFDQLVEAVKSVGAAPSVV